MTKGFPINTAAPATTGPLEPTAVQRAVAQARMARHADNTLVQASVTVTVLADLIRDLAERHGRTCHLTQCVTCTDLTEALAAGEAYAELIGSVAS